MFKLHPGNCGNRDRRYKLVQSVDGVSTFTANRKAPREGCPGLMGAACRRIVPALFLVLPALFLQGQESRVPPPSSPGTIVGKARQPFVDTHVHLEPGDPAGSVKAALRAMHYE